MSTPILPSEGSDNSLQEEDKTAPATLPTDTLANAQDLEKAKVEVEAEAADPFLVTWDDGEAANPLNWTGYKRWSITAVCGLLVFNATFASTAPNGIIGQLTEEFGVSVEVAQLQNALFVAEHIGKGYCVGPVLYGPLSEVKSVGRRKTMLYAFIPYTLLQIGCALTPSMAGLIVLRFIAGCFAACPLVVAGAAIFDQFPPAKLGLGMSVFALAPNAGPALGPIVGGFITVREVDWRILYWVCFGFAALCLLLLFLVIPETYAPTLLGRKAERIRKETGDDRYQTIYERKHKVVSFTRMVYDLLASPFIMLFQEPILLAITLYISFIYGTMYLCFAALGAVFQGVYGFNLGELGLCFLAFFLGGATCCAVVATFINPRYARLCKDVAPDRPPPEARLPMAKLAACLYFSSFFILGWSSRPSVTYFVPLIALYGVGYCSLALFMPLLSYIVDFYTIKAATAISANMIVRSLFGAVFPLFAAKMYAGLGVAWSSSLLGFVAIALDPSSSQNMDRSYAQCLNTQPDQAGYARLYPEYKVIPGIRYTQIKDGV